MTAPDPTPESADGRTATRRYGPAVGEPPVWVDPRRWGSLIGVAGGVVFVVSYADALGPVLRVVAIVLAALLAVAALVFHYVRPVALGPLTPPSRTAIAVYVACVAAELIAINLGSRALTAVGRDELRPALIAAVVGLHFLPFAWAFGERMFHRLGGVVAGLGVLGLIVGAVVLPVAAPIAAVVAGLAMLVIIVGYARGRFRLAR